MQGLSLAILLIGLGMALSDQKDIFIIILSMIIGALIGEAMNIEGGLERLGRLAAHRTSGSSEGSHVAQAFVTASLVFCVGSMAIVGAIQSGLQGNNHTLYAKSMLDFTSATVFSSTMGIGVALSAVPVFIYEGFIATLSFYAGNILNAPAVIHCMTATGGLLIAAIGINLLGLRKLAVGNLLPAMFVAGAIKMMSPHVVQITHHLIPHL